MMQTHHFSRGYVPQSGVQPLVSVVIPNHNGARTIERCLEAAGRRLPGETDRRALAQFVLTAMEGGVMQARTHRDVAYFDRAVAQLRAHFELLEQAAKAPA